MTAKQRAMQRGVRCGLVGLAMVGLLAAAAPPDLDAALETAVKEAVARAAPWLVRVQTVGGQEFIGSGREAFQRGQGPTSGIIVGADGWVLSSSFNFANRPTAVTVALPDRVEPLFARIVAHDRARQLTLLKVEASGLPTPPLVPKDQVRLGQWVVAVGRALADSASGPPSASLGVVSALDRIWGRAIQTDCKVSPVNYGGALIDLKGRLVGILAPLSPRGENESAGVEWYDSGIGFAVPLGDVLPHLEQLKAGKDLEPGRLGVQFQTGDELTDEVVVDFVLPGSAGAQVGLDVGDVVVAVDEKPTLTQSQLRHALGPRYAGDQVRLTVRRGTERKELPPVALQPPPRGQARAWLGILPMRDDASPGVEIRHVFKDGPADKAGLKAGDRLVTAEGRPIDVRILQALLQAAQPGQSLEFNIKRQDGKTDALKIKLGELQADLPMAADLRPGSLGKAPARPADAPPLPKGLEVRKDATLGRTSWLYVPETLEPGVSYGLMIWLHAPGEPLREPFVQAWKELAAKHHFILYGPEADSPTTWLTSEADAILADVRDLLTRLPINPQRIVAQGVGQGASMAWFLASDAPDLIRGVVAVNGPLPSIPAANEPRQRLLGLLVHGKDDPDLTALRSLAPRFAEAGHTVTERELEGHGSGYPLKPENLAELARWLDAVDRL